DYDGRTDIYSLGCVLYEAIAGVQAFMGPTSQVVIAQRLVHSPRSVRVYRPSVPPELEAVLDKSVALSPADRYATAGAFADALEAALPALDRPAMDPPKPLGRKQQRSWAWVVGSVVAVVAIAAFLERGTITHHLTR